MRRLGCLVAARAGAVILVSLTRALGFLFEAEERLAKGLDSRRASGPVGGCGNAAAPAIEGVSFVVRFFGAVPDSLGVDFLSL